MFQSKWKAIAELEGRHALEKTVTTPRPWRGLSAAAPPNPSFPEDRSNSAKFGLSGPRIEVGSTA